MIRLIYQKTLLALKLKINYTFSSEKKDLEQYHNPQELILEEMRLRENKLSEKHKQLQRIIDQKIQLPIKLYGIKDLGQTKFSYLPNRVMSYYNVNSSRITDYLLKIYKASLYAIADSNQQFMNQYWENNLKQKTIKGLLDAKNKKYQIKVIQSRNFLNSIQENCEIMDSIMVRGLSMNRSENNDPSQYKKVVQSQQVGLITYTPLKLTENNQLFINPITNKKAYDNYDRMVLRILLRIKTPLRLIVEEFSVDQQLYTWQHYCIMENSMTPPKQFKSNYKLETFLEWLGKYKFGIWKVADLDNFMKGNSLFPHRNYEQLDQVFKGTKFDKAAVINIRDF